MSLYPHLAPLLVEFACLVNQECTALDAHELASIEALLLYDVELPAKLFVRIRQELKRKFLLCLEFLVRSEAVSRNAEYDGVGTPEFCMQVAEILSFGRTTRCCVFWVEIEYYLRATQRFQVDRLIAGCGTLEVFNYAVQGWSGQWFLLLCGCSVIEWKSGFDRFQD